MDASERRLLALLIVTIAVVTFSQCAQADEEFARDAQGCIYVKRPAPRVTKPGTKVVKRKPGKSTPKTRPDEWDIIGCGDKAAPPAPDVFPPDTVVAFGPLPFEPLLSPGGLYTVPVVDVPPEDAPPVWFLPPPGGPSYPPGPPILRIPPTSPIPEPETWILLTLGLLLVSTRSRFTNSCARSVASACSRL